MRNSMLLAVAVLSAIGLAAPVKAAGFNNVILSAEKGASDNQSEFAPNTPKIYLSADLVDTAPGSKVTVSWISVDSHGVAPNNYKIDEITLDMGDKDHVNSSLSEPNDGWPVGTYRVDLAVNGTVIDSADFAVK